MFCEIGFFAESSCHEVAKASQWEDTSPHDRPWLRQGSLLKQHFFLLFFSRWCNIWAPQTGNLITFKIKVEKKEGGHHSFGPVYDNKGNGPDVLLSNQDYVCWLGLEFHLKSLRLLWGQINHINPNFKHSYCLFWHFIGIYEMISEKYQRWYKAKILS